MSTGGYAQIQHTVSFDRNQLEITSRQENGTNYTVVNYKDCVSDDQEGHPDLPYRFFSFIVPDIANSYKVEAISMESSFITLDYKVLPLQLLANGPNMIKELSVNQNSNVYNSISKFPMEVAMIQNDGYFDGNKRIITLKISPVQYIPSEDKLIFHSKIQIKIKSDDTARRKIFPINPFCVKDVGEIMRSLSFVINKEDISTYTIQQTENNDPNLLSTNIALSNCEYMIVTSAKYVPTLERLASWRRLKGISTEIVTMENILNIPTIIGDTVSGIYDNAGKLRQYLTHAYKNGTKYVFIVGKDMPFRYGTGWDNDWGSNNIDGHIPSDLYFSDLNGNWNVDKDQYYGEPFEDKLDLMPELYVGRLTCNNDEDLNNYIDKLFCYERDPGYGDNAYLNKALYVQADHLQEYGYADNFSNKMKPYFTQSTIMGELPGPYNLNTYFPKGSDVIREINKNYGLVSFYIHGWDDVISTLTNNLDDKDIDWKDGITYCDSYNRACIHEDGNGVDCLTNWNKPFIVYSVSCTTMPFDILTDDILHNIGEAFTLAGKYGAVAYLGNTRSGYGRCFDLEFANLLNSSEFHLGAIEAQSKSKSGSKYNALSHNLLGCPLIPMWTNAPSTLGNISIGNSGNNLSINTQIDECEIVVTGLFGSKSTIQKKIGRTCTFNNIPRNYAVTVYRHNYLPYIAPLYLQNEEVTGKHYIIGNKISLGDNVNQTKQTGNLIIKNKADVTIETSDCVTLDGGFTVEAGASFKIIPNK